MSAYLYDSVGAHDAKNFYLLCEIADKLRELKTR